MDSSVLVALLSLLGTLAGSLGGILVSSKLVNYRLQQLENRVAELPEHYRSETEKLIRRGALRGRTDGALDLSEDMLRTMLVCQRMVDEREEPA